MTAAYCPSRAIELVDDLATRRELYCRLAKQIWSPGRLEREAAS